MEIEETFLVEKNKDSEVVAGWAHFYQNQYPFPGFKNIPSDMVTISHARDIILDPHDLVPRDELPDSITVGLGKKTNTPEDKTKSWLANVGKASRLKIMSKRGKNKNIDRIITFLGVAFMLEIVIILILVARGGTAAIGG